MSPSPVNPLLDHIDQKYAELHPLAQTALEQGLLTGGSGLSYPHYAVPAQAPGPMGQPAAPPTPIAPIPGPVGARPIVPRETSAQLALIDEGSRLNRTGSGISQIHNPVLRGLAHAGEAAGSVFFGGVPAMLTPGTQLHHQMLVKQNQGAIRAGEEVENAQTKRAQEEAVTAGLPAKQELEEAQGEHARAQAEALRHPAPKEEMVGKTVETDQGVMQWNHETQRYDIKVGGAKAKGGGTVHQQEDGTFIIAHPDGTATTLTLNGEPVKGKPEKAGDDFEQFYTHYLKDKSLSDNSQNRLQARKMYAAAGQTPERAPQAMMLGEPDETGRRTAQLVRPGTVVGPHAVTPSGASGEQVSTDKQAAAAVKAKADANNEYQLVQTLAQKPSPTNDLAIVMRYIGATKPDSIGKLRLNQNEINLVMGTRSTFGDLQALMQKVQNGQMLVPKQRADMIETMKLLAGGAGGAGGGAGTDIRVKDIKSGRTGTIPPGEFDPKLYEKL